MRSMRLLRLAVEKRKWELAAHTIVLGRRALSRVRGGLTPARQKPGRGAPRGNQNARTHGFYSRALDEVEKIDFPLAATIPKSGAVKNMAIPDADEAGAHDRTRRWRLPPGSFARLGSYAEGASSLR